MNEIIKEAAQLATTRQELESEKAAFQTRVTDYDGRTGEIKKLSSNWKEIFPNLTADQAKTLYPNECPTTAEFVYDDNCPIDTSNDNINNWNVSNDINYSK